MSMLAGMQHCRKNRAVAHHSLWSRWKSRIYSHPMRRYLRSAFVALLSLALVASGTMLGGMAHAVAHNQAMHHASTGGHDSHAAHAHHARADHDQSWAFDDPPKASHDEAAKNCCSMCITATPLPPGVSGVVQFEISPTQYASHAEFGIAVTMRIDPGIPKRSG